MHSGYMQALSRTDAHKKGHHIKKKIKIQLLMSLPFFVTINKKATDLEP